MRHMHFLNNPVTPAFTPVKGAKDFLAHLSANTEWVPVVATGNWTESARFKLQSAHFSISCPIVSSNDRVSRNDIVKHAIESALHF